MKKNLGELSPLFISPSMNFNSQRRKEMRNRVMNNATQASIIDEVQVAENFLQLGKSYIEFRGTLKKASGTNQVAFYFHGGRVTLKKDGSAYFGKLRPLTWKKRNGEFVVGSDGDHELVPIWAKELVQTQNKVPSEYQQILSLASTAPLNQRSALLSLVPIEFQSKNVEYNNFDMPTFLNSISEGMENVEFTFNIPSMFTPVIQNIQQLLNVNDDYYSIRIIIDPSIPIYGKTELVEEFSTGELKKVFPIKPVWIGLIEGTTRGEINQSSFINPDTILRGLEKAKSVANSKSQSYLDPSFLKAQQEKMVARLSEIGTGKKAHHPILESIKTAVQNKDDKALQQNIALLKAVEERGTNSHVPAGFTEDFVEKALNGLFD